VVGPVWFDVGLLVVGLVWAPVELLVVGPGWLVVAPVVDAPPPEVEWVVLAPEFPAGWGAAAGLAAGAAGFAGAGALFVFLVSLARVTTPTDSNRVRVITINRAR
jgi:hypothetical protein